MIEITGRPPELLSAREKDLIHAASCEVLETIGVKVRDPKVIETFTKTGAAMAENGRLYLRTSVVEQALASAPETIRFDAPAPEHAFTLDASAEVARFGSGGQALYLLDRSAGSWERRAAGQEDLVSLLRLCDRLPYLDFVTRPVECDVPKERMDEEKARAFAANTTKPMNLANLVDPSKLQRVIEIVGSESYLSFIVCLVSSPLTVDDSAVERLRAVTERGIPVSISSCAQGGTTAPLSEAGELVQLNAEVLFGIAFVQTLNPGAPVLYRGIPLTADLFGDCSPRWCRPDSIRRLTLATELCRHYRLPCCGTAGVSDEREPNAQAIAEKALSLTYVALAGAQYINSAFGMLERVMTVAPAQYLIDNVIIETLAETLKKRHDLTARQAAQQVARAALARFGVDLGPEAESELEAQVAFIEDGREEYSRGALDRELETIGSAVETDGGSRVFMKSSRKGLRAGLLYTGERIQGELDLTCIQDDLESL